MKIAARQFNVYIYNETEEIMLCFFSSATPSVFNSNTISTVFLEGIEHFVDAALVRKVRFGHLVAFALEDSLEAGDSVFDLDVATLEARELFCHEERLREELDRKSVV